MRKIKILLKKIILIVIAIYAIVTFFNQQKILNAYAISCEDLDKQIEEANNYKEELNDMKVNANSEEYIEEAAREKLDMYLPNERVYVSNE